MNGTNCSALLVVKSLQLYGKFRSKMMLLVTVSVGFTYCRILVIGTPTLVCILNPNCTPLGFICIPATNGPICHMHTYRLLADLDRSTFVLLVLPLYQYLCTV